MRHVTGYAYRSGIFGQQPSLSLLQKCSNNLERLSLIRFRLVDSPRGRRTHVEQIRLLPVAANARPDDDLVVRQGGSVEVVDHGLVLAHIILHRV
jgi:hypothetical protein